MESGDNNMYEERILEQWIMTVKNEITIQRCISKNWDLSELLRKADEEENISSQMSCMQTMSLEQKVAREDRLYVKKKL